MMTKYFFYTYLFFLFGCSNYNDLEYKIIRDNLYSDKKGHLYLKSENNEDIDSVYVVWLKTVNCEDCRPKTENGFSLEKELHEIIDVESFHLDSIDGEHGVTFYSDKNYKYRHKWMADGGVLNAKKREK